MTPDYPYRDDPRWSPGAAWLLDNARTLIREGRVEDAAKLIKRAQQVLRVKR